MNETKTMSIRNRSLIFLGLTVVLSFSLLGAFFYFFYSESVEKAVVKQLNGASFAMDLVLTPEDLSAVDSDTKEDPKWKGKQDFLNSFSSIFSTSYVYALIRDSDGTFRYAYYDDPKQEFDDLLFLEPYGDAPPEVAQAWDTKLTKQTGFYTNKTGSFRSVFRPVFDRNDRVVAIFGANVDVADILAAKNQALMIWILSLVLEFVALCAFIFFMNQLIYFPLKEFTIRSKELAEGEGDLTHNLDFKSVGEIKTLAGHFNKFCDNLNVMVIRLKKVSSASHEISQDLAASSEEASSASVQIASNVRSMGHRAEQLNLQVQGSRTALDGISNVLASLVSKLGHFSGASDETFQVLSKMLEAIESTLDLARSNNEYAGALGDLATQGERDMKKTMDGFLSMAQDVQSISEMIKVVNDVSEQTNLLAMNASIEAAHAGQFGRGFSVVALEIRKLAEATGRNAKEITDSLNIITDRIQHTSELAKGSSGSFQKMVEGIYKVREAMGRMSSQMQVAKDSSSALNSSMDELRQIGDAIATSSSEIHVQSDKIKVAVESVAELSEESRSSMAEMVIGLDEIKQSINQVAALSAESTNSVQIIDEELSRFKTKEVQT